jgi:hypothetical protein
MRHLFTFTFLFTIVFAKAQVPQAFNYQGIARDTLGNPIANKTLSVRASILSGSVSGTVQYSETQSPKTNQFGLYTLAIGSGNVVTGSFSGINWGQSVSPSIINWAEYGNKNFLKIEIDPNGGTSYVLSGTTQLLSVPYAQYAKYAENFSRGMFLIDSGSFNTTSGVINTIGLNPNFMGEITVVAQCGSNSYSSIHKYLVNARGQSSSTKANPQIQEIGTGIQAAFDGIIRINVTISSGTGTFSSYFPININAVNCSCQSATQTYMVYGQTYFGFY